ncbi:iron-sulfur cluster carrier protein ApbC [Paremcibacter congregatus]|uniref:Iron-sulfur cluster carrier protein n=1 Tax=Paremcibacter congregatus TaxID=2043170 RepID=A0A2G4YRL4_9PROT|nr:iron-sulfur cluster carrier protein ApbC [Paremcibacter congregatus]PHZ84953.1 iron-sulfur cluster carrier protein ApbC [Paremcibacter congregatus]QDE26073.1 iron-sulfur cluster carrier protein ApbC [Paremcibacter congregatus]
MSEIKRDDVLNCLKTIQIPSKGQDIVSLGMIQGLVIKETEIGFALNIDPQDADAMEQIRQTCDAKLMALAGVEKVVSVLTAERAPGEAMAKPATSPRMPQHGPADSLTGPQPIPGVKHIIAVASGKGGVGKSTTSVNLALGLQSLGLKVGILDVDIYGPSIPTLLGVTEKPTQDENKNIIPIIKHGLVSMSLGYLMKQNTATIWRGPMVMGAVKQMIADTKWDVDGELDVLVLDLPPGTGDVQLTLAQNVAVNGAVVVSTPQDIALIDARKGLDMFQKTNVPVFGLVENMSYFLCPSCGERADIFGHGGARDTAQELGMDFLGAIPLHMDIRSTSDQGTPIVTHQPDSPHTAAYIAIARQVADKL